MPNTTANPAVRQRSGAELPSSVSFTSKPAAPASKPDRNGGLVASQRSAQVIPVPCLDQAAIGITSNVIADEYPRATPLGPWLKPNTIPKITSGVVAVLILNALPIGPTDKTNQENGFATANTTATGASNLKIGAASIHFSPSTTRTISSANRAQLMVIGMVADMSNEKPLRKDLARRLASC